MAASVSPSRLRRSGWPVKNEPRARSLPHDFARPPVVRVFDRIGPDAEAVDARPPSRVPRLRGGAQPLPDPSITVGADAQADGTVRSSGRGGRADEERHAGRLKEAERAGHLAGAVEEGRDE